MGLHEIAKKSDDKVGIDKLVVNCRISHIESLIIDNLHKNSFNFDIIKTKMEELCNSINESISILKDSNNEETEDLIISWFDMLFKLNCLIQLKLSDAKKEDEEGFLSTISIEDLVTS